MPYAYTLIPGRSFPMPDWFEVGTRIRWNSTGRHFTITRVDELSQRFHVVETQNPDKWLAFAFKEHLQFDPIPTAWDQLTKNDL